MTRTHRSIVAALCAVFATVLNAPPTFAQSDHPAGTTALQLTVDEALRRAVDNNPDLAVLRLGTQVEAERVGEALSAYAPVFSTVLGRSSNTAPPSNFLLGDKGIDARDWFSSTGVRQRLPLGSGTWSVSWDASRTATNNPLSSFAPSLQSGFQVAFSQPLLKDRRIDTARVQRMVAARNQETSELRYNESVVQTLAAVKQAYWTLKAAAANVSVQQRSLELAYDLARENKSRVDLGQAPPIDLVQSESEVAERRENLIRATATAEDAEDHLRRLIIDPADVSFWQVHLEPVDEAAGGVAIADVDAIVANALTRRYDLARARNDLENARTNVDFLSNQKLPDVRLEASYRGDGLGGTELLRTGSFPGVITGRRSTGFGDVLGQTLGRNYPTWSFGLTASYTLGRSYEEAGAVRAELERRQMGRRISSMELKAAETIRQAARQVRSSAERVDAARAGATLAKRRLDTEQRRYEVGLSTSFLVTQAQRDLLQAEVNLLQATLDHQSSLVSFEALQQAPALADVTGLSPSSAPVLQLPPSAPRGLFRTASSSGF
jgi:outer membrane protein TolC